MNAPFKKIDPAQFKRCWLDIPYAQDSPRQVLDLWLPDEGEGPFPLIVFVHGGGWVFGDKRENTMPGIFKMPSQGYAVACIEYRLAPEVRWPLPLFDVRSALRYLRAHSQRFGVKADKIALIGNSAGAHLTNMVAALAGRSCLRGDGNLDYSDAVQCLVNLFTFSNLYEADLCDRSADEVGPLLAEMGLNHGERGMDRYQGQLLGFCARDYPAAALAASPVSYVNEEFPPALYLHGIDDHITPYTQTVGMVNAVNDRCGSGRASAWLFPGADHGDEAMKDDKAINAILDFIDGVLWEGPHERTHLPDQVRLIE